MLGQIIWEDSSEDSSEDSTERKPQNKDSSEDSSDSFEELCGPAPAPAGGAVQKRRMAWDGEAYTEEDFQLWYGDDAGQIIWASASPEDIASAEWLDFRADDWLDGHDRWKRERAHENLEAGSHHREQAEGLVVGAGRGYFQLVNNMYAGTAAKAAAAAEPTTKKTLPADAMHAVG